jgi:hypothetical protein
MAITKTTQVSVGLLLLIVGSVVSVLLWTTNAHAEMMEKVDSEYCSKETVSLELQQIRVILEELRADLREMKADVKNIKER